MQMLPALSSLNARYFLEVANRGSVAEAAERLHIAGSAISRQIKALELELGIVLFERKARGMVLTEAGSLLADHVRRVGLEEQRILDALSRKPQELKGTIRIAANPGFVTHFVPVTVAKFQQRHPLVRFQVTTRAQLQLEEEIRQGVSDLGINFGMYTSKDMVVYSRVVAPFYAFVSPQHPLAERSSIDLNDVSEFPVAVSTKTSTSSILELRASTRGIAFNISFESDNSNSLFSYVNRTQAVAFGVKISALGWLERNALVAIPLNEPEQYERSIEFKVMAGRKLPAYLEEFIRFGAQELHDQVKELSAQDVG